jgi:hypothetical protein
MKEAKYRSARMLPTIQRLAPALPNPVALQ